MDKAVTSLPVKLYARYGELEGLARAAVSELCAGHEIQIAVHECLAEIDRIWDGEEA